MLALVYQPTKQAKTRPPVQVYGLAAHITTEVVGVREVGARGPNIVRSDAIGLFFSFFFVLACILFNIP